VLTTGCSYEGSGAGSNNEESAKLCSLTITVNDAYFDEPWLIVELTLENRGKQTEYFLFAPYSIFYIRDSIGHIYKNINVRKGKWEEAFGTIALFDLELEPEETMDLTLQCFDVPEDTKNLRLFCKDSAIEGGNRISIPLHTGIVKSLSETAVDEEQNYSESDPWAEAAIDWAESHVGSDHWYQLCLRFAANAFVQYGSPPLEVPEGTWTSAWDAINRDEEFDLVLHDPGNWRNAPRGALVFFGQTSANTEGHVGLCLGDGEMIHAYGIVRINGIGEAGNLDGGRLIGSYIGWAYPPDRWRTGNSVSTVSPDTYPATPEQVLRAYYEAAYHLDYDGVKQFMSAGTLDEFLSMFPSEHAFLQEFGEEDWEEFREALAQVHFVTEYVEDDIVLVSTVSDVFGDEVWTLTLENGLWKIAI